MYDRINLLERPLDWVFSAPNHIAILRALSETKVGMSGRAVARQANVNHQACAVAIRKLEMIGIIERMGGGRTQLIRLHFGHFLVRELLLPLLQRERTLRTQIHQDIIRHFQSIALTATLFGSAIRHQVMPGSDIDLLLIVPPSTRLKVTNSARDFAGNFVKKYGIRFSPFVFTAKRARARLNRSDPLFQNILLEGIDLLPKKLKDVLR